MKRFAATLAVLALAAAPAFAADKTYQVTGPIVAVTDTTITVEKGKEKWEIAIDASTKGAAGVKVGDKVTIEYKMIATSVEVKAADAKKDAAPKKDAKKK